MNKKNRKGFTIVELVIVIAVIGILTAILIPTFMGITDKAHQTENETFVRNINTQLAINEASGNKNPTMYEAVKDAQDMGFDVEKITPYNGNDIIWDSVNDRFAIVKADYATVTNKKDSIVYADGSFDVATDLHKLWKIYPDMPDSQTYSIYAKNTWTTPTEIDNLKVGFDAGTVSKIKSITYTGNVEAVIRTNGGALTVNAPEGSVSHYGFATTVDVNNVAVGTFHAYGKIGRLKYNDNNGKIRFEDGSVTYCYMNKSDDANADAGSATKNGNAEVYTSVTSAGSKDVYEGKDVGDLINGKEVSVAACHNHNVEFDVIDIFGEKYMVCRCCGAYSKYTQDSDEPVDASPEMKDPETGAINKDIIPGPYTKYGFANSYQVPEKTVGTVTTPEHWVHEIESAKQLENIADYFNSYRGEDGPIVLNPSDPGFDQEEIDLAKYNEFRLTKDIDMSGITNSALVGTTFIGVFDGNGKSVSNYTFSDNGVSGFGLFGYFYDGATAKDLTLDYFDIEVGDFSGLLFGQSWYDANGFKKTVSGTSLSLVNVTIGDRCTIRGGKGIGGVVGNARYIETVNATNVVNKANVIASIYNAGGIFGTVSSVQHMNLNGCKNYGTVLAPANVAGLVGHGGPKNATITGCENHGRITTYAIDRGTTVAGWFIGGVNENASTTYAYSNNKIFSEGKIYYTSTNKTVIEANSFAKIFENGKLGSGIAMENGKSAADYRDLDDAALMHLEYDNNNQWVINNAPANVATYTISMQIYARDVRLTADEGKVTVLKERGLTYTKKFTSLDALHDGFARITRAGYVLDNRYNTYDYDETTTSYNSTRHGRANFFRLPYSQRNNYDLGNIHFDSGLGEWVYIFDAQAGFAEGAGQILSPKDTWVKYVVSAYDAAGRILAVGIHEDLPAPETAGSFLKNMAGDEFLDGNSTTEYPLVV